MGSCISKCSPKPISKKNPSKKQEDDPNPGIAQFQEKLVIEIPPLKSPLSPSHSSSSSSSSSFSCTTNCQNSSSSTSSCASSISISKHISSPIILLDPNKLPGNRVFKVAPPSLPPYPASGPTQKRQRASSPNLARQKSFRRDPVVGPTSLRSPSPSRRFITSNQERNNKRAVANSYVKKEIRKGLSDPNNRSRRSFRSPSMRKGSEIRSLSRVISQDVEMLPVEDLNNPLIALDCFIFL